MPTVSPATPAPFTVTVSSDVDQTYNFNIVGVGTDRLQRQQQKLVTFTSTGGSGTRGFSFTLTPASSIQSLPAGQPAIYILDVVPSGGAFPGNATLAYSSNCPPLSTCSLSPTQVSKGSSQRTQVTFTITTTCSGYRDVAPRPQISRLCVVAFVPGIARSFRRTGEESPQAIRAFRFACSRGSRTMAGDCMQQRSPRQWYRWKWTGWDTSGDLHHDCERHCELASATDGASAVDG